MDQLTSEVATVIKDKKLWNKTEPVLVAVSTGVDSMVLLHLLKEIQPQGMLGVVHVNHNLRSVSDSEALFLKEYCEEKCLPFYHTKWQEPVSIGVEQAAREFRYHFFKETMNDYGYPVLVTAHHQDDQMETMLMKIIRTGSLDSAAGIRFTQPFQGVGRLVRPLLGVSKKRLLAYSQKYEIPYFEDETNQSLAMQRNRLRHQVIPQLKKENPRVGEHFQHLSEELLLAQELISEKQKVWYDSYVVEESNQLSVNISDYQKLSEAGQYFFIQKIAQVVLENYQLVISKKQQKEVHELLEKGVAQWSIDLGKDWQFEKEYTQLYFRKRRDSLPEVVMPLFLDQPKYLSEHEWIGLFSVGKEEIPEKVKLWSEYRQSLTVYFPEKVWLRRRKAGDRIKLTEKMTKKVSRLFIDRKLSHEKREKAWILEDGQGQILGVLPHAFSYLSIAKETDRIHYVLLYKYQE